MPTYLNGQFVDDTDAKLSAFDAAVQHGVGLFETMRAYRGTVFELEAHIARITDSARQLGLTDRIEAEPLAEAVRLALQRSEKTEARVRLTITGGDLSLLAAARTGDRRGPHQPSVMIQVAEPTTYPEGFIRDGVGVVVADARANPLDPAAGHKTINYWTRLRTLTAAAAAQAAEALWLSVSNHLCGGAVSNAFLVKDGVLLTPFARGEEVDGALPSPVLPGTTRRAILEEADAADVKVERRMLAITDVLGADECFLTNSSWGVLPVVRVEAETIGEGAVGAVTQKLYQALLERIDRQCPPA